MRAEIREVLECPRCDGRHDALHFFALERPVGHYTLWALCPKGKGPVLAETLTTSFWGWLRALRGVVETTG